MVLKRLAERTDEPDWGDESDPAMEYEHGEAIDSAVRAALDALDALDGERGLLADAHSATLTAGFDGRDPEKARAAWEEATLREATAHAVLTTAQRRLADTAFLVSAGDARAFAFGWAQGRDWERERILYMGEVYGGSLFSPAVKAAVKWALEHLFFLNDDRPDDTGVIDPRTGAASEYAVNEVLTGVMESMRKPDKPPDDTGWIRADAGILAYRRVGDDVAWICSSPNLYYGIDGWRLTRGTGERIMAIHHDTSYGALMGVANRWLERAR